MGPRRKVPEDGATGDGLRGAGATLTRRGDAQPRGGARTSILKDKTCEMLALK